MPLPRRVSFLVQVIQGTPVPQSPMNLEVGGGAVEGDGICGVGLHFDRISPARLCHVNDTVSVIDVAVVVGGHFGNDVRRMVNADWAIVNAEILLHILIHRYPTKTQHPTNTRQ